ncbi:tRNA threonylcarbamoyladenosine biosynthesis protein TsaB [Candidatus Erwinia haradaeae]|uniref:tRNA threonylcarbamoyladenosine biosynthesis protein TsaB n=1 Tax=Candidatus Erwinia haradaeae TaxID=1922217 RepID=A0A451DDI4_9GAMM|nr:tRNA (adenosine(37)-N6)-threonylcarbamoyltransferase complex dimerization subunit type 1 TsaB [Candidatus Erwinia haradaeae]VFP84511.1 tRNA threonylcarbamoyladenosine biosynthesis protein TsaB [Candidatus Erwinia haradaeae]
MQILALDTTTQHCSVALLTQKGKFSYCEHCAREHTQYLLPFIHDILQKCKVSLHEIDLLAFARGPGSFSGVRICLATAQGLALGANIPLTGISTLKIMAETAWRHHGAKKVLVANDAHMGDIYWAEYQRKNDGNWSGEDTESLLKPAEIIKRMTFLRGKWFCVGTGWKLYPQLTHISNIDLMVTIIKAPHAVDMIPLVQNNLSLESIYLPRNAKPYYLRHKVC